VAEAADRSRAARRRGRARPGAAGRQTIEQATQDVGGVAHETEEGALDFVDLGAVDVDVRDGGAGQNSATLPVARSSKRAPMARSRSASSRR